MPKKSKDTKAKGKTGNSASSTKTPKRAKTIKKAKEKEAEKFVAGLEKVTNKLIEKYDE